MRLPVLLACAAVLTTGCEIQVGERGVTSIGITEGRARDEWVRSYPLQAGGTLEIINVNGRIEAQAGTGSQVEVRAERTIRDHATETAEAELKRVQMREEVTGTRVRIEAQPPRAEGLMDHSSLTVNYRVTVPPGVALVLKSDNGPIRLNGLDGPVTAATINGGITGVELSGPVALNTTNGDIRLELPAPGDVKAATINGNVRLDLTPELKATLDATCVNGSINVEEGLGLQVAEKSERRVTGTFNGGGPRLEASTVNGGIRVRTRDTQRRD